MLLNSISVVECFIRMPRAPSCSACPMSRSPTSAVSSSVRTGGVMSESSRSTVSPGVSGITQVEEQDVGTQLAHLPDGIATVPGLAHDAHIGIALEQLPQRFTKQRVIVGDDDGDRAARRRGHLCRSNLSVHAASAAASGGRALPLRCPFFHPVKSPCRRTTATSSAFGREAVFLNRGVFARRMCKPCNERTVMQRNCEQSVTGWHANPSNL